jgi:hypothetical protein
MRRGVRTRLMAGVIRAVVELSAGKVWQEGKGARGLIAAGLSRAGPTAAGLSRTIRLDAIIARNRAAVRASRAIKRCPSSLLQSSTSRLTSPHW